MLVCSECAASHAVTEARWRCNCGGYLLLQDPAMFSPEALADRPPTLWRYREALGLSDSANPVTLGEGYTPLAEAGLDGERVFLKLDFLGPTGSFKDRGSAVMISKLKEWGVREILEDSSGNAGASIAAYAARAGIRSTIYIPAATSTGKAAQIGMYGAELVKVPGSREDTARAAWDAAGRTYYASHNWNPYFLTGMKTAAYEIAEQLSWQAPDWIVVPVGGGGLLAGVYLGFCDLLRAGLVSRMPRLAAIQSAGCDPVFRAWTAGRRDIPAVEKKPTAAEGISVAKPVRGPAILEAINKSQGVARTVKDDAVWNMVQHLGQQGFYVEPTSAAAPAALAGLRAEGIVQPSDRVVVLLTGSGLKATDKIVERFTPVEAMRSV